MGVLAHNGPCRTGHRLLHLEARLRPRRPSDRGDPRAARAPGRPGDHRQNQRALVAARAGPRRSRRGVPALDEHRRGPGRQPHGGCWCVDRRSARVSRSARRVDRGRSQPDPHPSCTARRRRHPPARVLGRDRCGDPFSRGRQLHVGLDLCRLRGDPPSSTVARGRVRASHRRLAAAAQRLRVMSPGRRCAAGGPQLCGGHLACRG